MANIRRDVDWQSVQNSYRCKSPSIRLLAQWHGVAEGTIRARAKRENWRHDLAAQVRAKVRRDLMLDLIGELPPRPAPPAPIKFTRDELIAIQREHLAERIPEWRALGEKCNYLDVDGNIRLLGWELPKRDRPRCGAKTRAAGSCKAPAVSGKERCRMHGGLSTGPQTAEGKARTLAALKAGLQRYHAERRRLKEVSRAW